MKTAAIIIAWAAATLAANAMAQTGGKTPENVISNDALTQRIDFFTEDANIVSWNTDDEGHGSMFVVRLNFAGDAPAFAMKKMYWGSHAYDMSDVHSGDAEELGGGRKRVTLRAGVERLIPGEISPSFPGVAMIVYTVEGQTKQYVVESVMRNIESREARKSR